MTTRLRRKHGHAVAIGNRRFATVQRTYLATRPEQPVSTPSSSSSAPVSTASLERQRGRDRGARDRPFSKLFGFRSLSTDSSKNFSKNGLSLSLDPAVLCLSVSLSFPKKKRVTGKRKGAGGTGGKNRRSLRSRRATANSATTAATTRSAHTASAAAKPHT